MHKGVTDAGGKTLSGFISALGFQVGRGWGPEHSSLTLSPPTEHQSWRLTGGADSCEGQVEVQFRGVWSTVCDSEWYPSEAKVLCRSLGCGSEVDRPRGLPHSLEGRMYYSCGGEELSLSNCSWRFNNSNLCSQSLAARVVCSGSPSLSPPPLDFLGLATSRYWPKKDHCPYRAQAHITNQSGFFFSPC